MDEIATFDFPQHAVALQCFRSTIILQKNVINVQRITLTHLPKMAVMSQTILSDVFSWTKSFVCWLNFPKGLLNKNSIGFDNGLAPSRRQAIIWTSAEPIYWRIYAALVGDELK